MLEILLNEKQFDEIKNKINQIKPWIYSNPFLALYMTEILQEWRNCKDEYFVCFYRKNKNGNFLYCKLENITIAVKNNLLMYSLKLKNAYIVDENCYKNEEM